MKYLGPSAFEAEIDADGDLRLTLILRPAVAPAPGPTPEPAPAPIPPAGSVPVRMIETATGWRAEPMRGNSGAWGQGATEAAAIADLARVLGVAREDWPFRVEERVPLPEPTPEPMPEPTPEPPTDPPADPEPDPAPLPTPEPAPVTTSPTGREPRLFWTPERQAVWQRMHAERHPWMVAALLSGERSGTVKTATWPGPVYGDIGLWATLAYQTTGMVRYAEKAWAQIVPMLGKDPDSRNVTREHFVDLAWMFDWLQPALDTSQRAQFVGLLERWADLALAKVALPARWGTRTSDSDETTGHLAGLTLAQAVAGMGSTRLLHLLAGSWKDGGTTEKWIGGRLGEHADRSTMRNAVRQYCEIHAEGGVWPESTQYNLGTLKLLLMLVEGSRHRDGSEWYFPEVTALLPALARALCAEVTPDLSTIHMWGDTERPYDMDLSRRASLLAMVAGLLEGTHEGACVQGLLLDLIEKYGTGYGGCSPMPRALLFWNPWAERADYRSLPLHLNATGQGVQIYRSGHTPAASVFACHFPKTQPVTDHEVERFGDFWLYRNGEWVVKRPLGYGAPEPPLIGATSIALGANTMLLAGLGAMAERRCVASEADPAGRYLYTAGTTSGPYYGSDPKPYYDAPPAFVREWTRSLLYLPAPDGSSDTVIVFDRVHATPPARLDRYRKADQDRIRAFPLKTWLFHLPVRGNVAPQGFGWIINHETPEEQWGMVKTLLPKNAEARPFDEAQLWPSPAYDSTIHADQKGWQVRVSPLTEQPWDTFLHVITASSRETFPKASLIESASGEAQGCLIQREGQPDALVLFSARPESRLHATGFEVTFEASTDTTEVFIADLDPAREWLASDGDRSATLLVSNQGLASRVRLGAGSHTLRVVAGVAGVAK